MKVNFDPIRLVATAHNLDDDEQQQLYEKYSRAAQNMGALNCVSSACFENYTDLSEKIEVRRLCE